MQEHKKEKNTASDQGDRGGLSIFQLQILTVLWFCMMGVSLFFTSRVFAKEPALIRRAPDIERVMIEIQRGRETGDASYFARAEKWLNAGSKEGKNEAKILGLKAWVALFQHRFQMAATLAEQARILSPATPFYYGVLSDANLEMGNYDLAIAATEKMLDLKPDQGALSRAAHLRALHGDETGAIELWQEAIAAGAYSPENTAWSQVELGNLFFDQAKLSAAQDQYEAALKTTPEYHRALAGLASLFAAKQESGKAIRLYQQASAAIPLLPYSAALGALYLSEGESGLAAQQFEQVAVLAKLDQLSSDSANRELALFYANLEIKLADALSIAKQVVAQRKDIESYDVLAWAYYKNGQYQNAYAAIQKTLRLGTRNARFYFHAGMIAKALGKTSEVKIQLNLALKQNPYFNVRQAEIARKILKTLSLEKGANS